MRRILLYIAGAIFSIYLLPVSATTHYVDPNGTNASPPFTNWSTAATSIQDAIDVAGLGDVVLVTNGIYQSGGRLVTGVSTTNRVAVTQALTVQSVNGPAVTSIQGYQVPGTTNDASAVRCIYLADGAALTGFTLTDGATDATTGKGGGIWFQSVLHPTSVVSNCVLTGNSAGGGGGGVYGGGTLISCMISNNWAGAVGGGGAYGCILVNCVLSGNFTRGAGGGSIVGVLTNCLLVGNSAGGPSSMGGGSYGEKLVNCTVVSNSATVAGGGVNNSSLMFNCIVYFNSASQGANYYDAPVGYCCTTPSTNLLTITSPPLFVDPSSGDYHLQSNSPCINSGRNSYIKTANDLDNNPRIVGGTVDIGAYEFQSPSSVLSYAWAQQYGLPTDGSADFADTDGDNMNNWQEWLAGTVPTNSASVLQMFSPSISVSGLVVSWQSVNTRTYFLQRTTDLGTSLAFSTIQSNIVGQADTTTYTDTMATNSSRYFYRVGVQ